MLLRKFARPLGSVVGVFGAGILVDFFESVIFGEYINPAAIWLFDKIIPVALIRDLFVGEYGIITMALSYGFLRPYLRCFLHREDHFCSVIRLARYYFL